MNFRLIVTPIAAIVMGAPALAAPIHLTCKDVKATDNGEPSDLMTYSLFVDPDTGQATSSGSAMELTASADALTLHSQSKKRGEFISSLSIKSFTINRSDLSFKRVSTLLLQDGYASPVRMPSQTTKWLSNGQCQITKMPAGNKI